jgi:hypothetical protein
MCVMCGFEPPKRVWYCVLLIALQCPVGSTLDGGSEALVVLRRAGHRLQRGVHREPPPRSTCDSTHQHGAATTQVTVN